MASLRVHHAVALAAGAGGELLELSKALLSRDTGLCPLSHVPLPSSSSRSSLALALTATAPFAFLCRRSLVAVVSSVRSMNIHFSYS